jgi:hypothetical protein
MLTQQQFFQQMQTEFPDKIVYKIIRKKQDKYYNYSNSYITFEYKEQTLYRFSGDLNISFNDDANCEGSGLYFTDKKNIYYWACSIYYERILNDIYIAKCSVPDYAKVVVGYKEYKTDYLYVNEIISYEDYLNSGQLLDKNIFSNCLLIKYIPEMFLDVAGGVNENVIICNYSKIYKFANVYSIEGNSLNAVLQIQLTPDSKIYSNYGDGYIVNNYIIRKIGYYDKATQKYKFKRDDVISNYSSLQELTEQQQWMNSKTIPNTKKYF